MVHMALKFGEGTRKIRLENTIGIATVRFGCAAARLPLPASSHLSTYVVLTIYRRPILRVILDDKDLCALTTTFRLCQLPSNIPCC